MSPQDRRRLVGEERELPLRKRRKPRSRERRLHGIRSRAIGDLDAGRADPLPRHQEVTEEVIGNADPAGHRVVRVTGGETPFAVPQEENGAIAASVAGRHRLKDNAGVSREILPILDIDLDAAYFDEHRNLLMLMCWD